MGGVIIYFWQGAEIFHKVEVRFGPSAGQLSCPVTSASKQTKFSSIVLKSNNDLATAAS